MSTYSKDAPTVHKYHQKVVNKRLYYLNDSFAKDPNRLLKQGIWLYFLLLIFEGALRKWLLPGLATPLLLIRDPIAIWLLTTVWYRNLLPSNIYLISAVTIGILGIFTATMLGHGSFPVALFGARILLIHFPLMFVIGRLFNQKDVIDIGKAVLWIIIPMTVLTALQFYSPQSAWVNRGVGGDIAGAGFSGIGEYSRPPGTFSFTNGLSCFYGFTTPFIFFFWLNTKNINRLLLIGATIALIVAIPLSISRGLFFQVGVSILFVMLIILRKPEYSGKLILALIGIIFVISALSQTSFFITATEAFMARFEVGSSYEGGLKGTLVDRYLGGMIEALLGNEAVPFLGYGLGIGTNVGSMLLTGGRTFLISEEEWGRVIGELGPLMGIALIMIRVGFCIKITSASYYNLVKGNLLPWLLLSYGLTTIPQGQWSQPTALGFSTLIGGLIIASLRTPPINRF